MTLNRKEAPYFRINGHGHLLPEPNQIPSFMKSREIFWVGKDKKYMYQKDWSRPITDPSFFLQGKLEWMDRFEINHEVLLTLSQLYCNGMSERDAYDAIRFQNDFNANIQAEYPKRFTSGFVVQPAFINSALNEIRRCVEELKLRLLCLPTHFLDEDGQWCSVANEKAEPIFRLADDYKLAVEIHPYDGPKMIALKNVYWRFHLVWMCAQTADTFHIYTVKSYPEIFQNLRVCFAHANQFGQVNMGRRIQGYKGRPDLFEGMASPEVFVKHSNIFYDAIVHDLLALRLLVARQGVSQIIAGIDDPYPLGEMDTVEGSYPGRILDDAVEDDIISSQDMEEIWFDNPVRWLAGHDPDVFLNRIGYKV